MNFSHILTPNIIFTQKLILKSFYSSSGKPNLDKPQKDNNKRNNSNEKDKDKSINSKIDPKWKYVFEVWGLTPEQKRSHVLAFQYFYNNQPVTAKTINELLEVINIKTTDEQLKRLVNSKSFSYHDFNKITLDEIKKKLREEGNGAPVPGIYIFTHIPTGNKYVGSSNNLLRRINEYFKGWQKNSGLIIPLLKKERNKNFLLEIFPLIDNYEKDSEIILEQYYLLNPLFTLNTLRHVTGAGSAGKPIFMYNRDMSILYYYTSEQINLIRNFSVHHTTFTKHLNDGTYYLGKYVFLREPVLTAKVKDMSDTDLAIMLEKDRVAFNKSKPINSLSKSVKLIDVNKSDSTFQFESLGKAINFLRNKGLPATQVTLVKRLNTNIPYCGYYVKTF